MDSNDVKDEPDNLTRFDPTIVYGGLKIDDNYYASHSRGKQSITKHYNKGSSFSLFFPQSKESLTEYIAEALKLAPFFIEFDPKVHVLRMFPHFEWYLLVAWHRSIE
jgi:hypothetical protein